MAERRTAAAPPAQCSSVGSGPAAISPELRTDTDRGSAVAEFVMVTAMLMVLFLGLLQVCLWAYARTMVTSAAAEVARHAALSGSTDRAVTEQMRVVLGDGLGTGTKSTLTCTGGGTAILAQVHCTMDAPGLVGVLDGVMPQVDITAHAAREATR